MTDWQLDWLDRIHRKRTSIAWGALTLVVSLVVLWGLIHLLTTSLPIDPQTLRAVRQLTHLSIAVLAPFLYSPYLLGALTIPLFVFVVTIATFVYKIVEAGPIVRTTLIHSLLASLLTAIYLVIVLLIERWLQTRLGYHRFPMTLLFVVLLALFLNPLRYKVQALIDRVLFRATPVELAAQRDQLLAEVRKGEQMRTVGTLAAGLAHEIKNPLASIKTFTDYLNTHFDDPEFRAKFTKIVGGEVERINLIVQQLLEFAKPVPPKLMPVEIPRLLDETVDLLGNELVKRHVQVTRRYEARPQILGDPQQLKQVFLNLLLNSLDAVTPPPAASAEGGAAPFGAGPPGKRAGGGVNGSGRLELATSVRGAELEVIVSDNGAGIPPKDLPHLFEPFFTTKSTGTGLGLAVVHGIVNEHRGRIKVESHPGKGTRIIIALPIAMDHT